MKIKRQKLSDQKFVIFGQGQAGLGIARQLVSGLRAEGLSETEARAHLFGIDKDGLLVEGMSVSEEQKFLLKDKSVVADWKLADPNKITLLDTIKNAGATVLIGVTGQSGAFNEEILRQMAQNCELPMVMPLSNPTAKAECTPENALRATGGRCLVATGSPFAPVKVDGGEQVISQCNNLYIFPGVGLGALVAGTPVVTDEMFIAASQALSNMVTTEELDSGRMLPAIQKIRLVSEQVALAVAKEARDAELGIRQEDEILLKMIRNAMWQPKYLPYRYVRPDGDVF